MSTSRFMITLHYAMLEGRKECVPGFEDSSGGHRTFSLGPCKLKVRGPDSNTFDGITWGLHGESLSAKYDEEALVDRYAKELAKDLTFDDNRMLKFIVKSLFEQAKEHCDFYHTDERIKHGVMCKDHDEKLMCHCDCHGRRILLHDHACCSKCDKCEFRTRCSCEHCRG